MRKKPMDEAKPKPFSKASSQKLPKLKNKEFEGQLAKLEVELVKLQFWVKSRASKSSSFSRGATRPERAG